MSEGLAGAGLLRAVFVHLGAYEYIPGTRYYIRTAAVHMYVASFDDAVTGIFSPFQARTAHFTTKWR